MQLHSGSAFWPLRDGLLATYPPLREHTTADVVVMGAGITGALVAHELTSAGASVVVLDRDEVASGSTAATSGLLLYDTDRSLEELIDRIGEQAAAAAYRLGLQAIDRIEGLCRELNDPCGFARRDSLYLASSRRAVGQLEREFALRRRLGFDVELFARRDIERRFSFSAPAAIYARGTGEIDCYRFTHRLLARARDRGARIYDRTAITRVRRGRAGISVDTPAGCTVRAARLVCCTGYEAALQLRRKTGRLVSTWAMVTEPVDSFAGWPDRVLIWETARPYFYLRTTEDDRVLAGGSDEPGAERHRSRAALERKAHELLARTRHMFPRLTLDLAYAWGGTFATTDDGLPFIGELPEYPGVSFALGYGGNGLTFSVVAARMLGDAYAGRPHPGAAIFGFDRRRRR